MANVKDLPKSCHYRLLLEVYFYHYSEGKDPNGLIKVENGHGAKT
jgi:hypothetical protein